MTTEPKARIEKVVVEVDEVFPLAFHDEVLMVEDTSSGRQRLTVLRRGL